MPNGSLEWSYSWHELDGYHDKYSILPLSYGVIWTGPAYNSNLDWQDEINDRIAPYIGPTQSSNTWTPVFSHDGEWIDVYQGKICSSKYQTQEIPIIYNEIPTGISCAYYYSNKWNFASFSIDIDNDNYGHNADAFPFESTQQIDTDLDGYGDNIFGNNSDECPNEPGNSTRQIGLPGHNGDGQSNLNDFYPTDSLKLRTVTSTALEII